MTFVELHLQTVDEAVLRALERLGYSAAAVVGDFDIARAQEATNILLVRKVMLGAPRPRGRHWPHIVAVVPRDRFALNKFIRKADVDVITISEVDEGKVPSKAQARVMAREGKALEIVVNPILSRGSRGLSFLRRLLETLSTVDELPIIVSQGIAAGSDVRNPRDVAALLSLIEPGRGWISSMSELAVGVIVDAMFRRGVCIG